MRFRLRWLAWLLALPLLVSAQQTANLTGTLTDPSGAAVTDAAIIATPLAAGPAVRTQSDAAGHFALALAPGRYRVRVEHRSFARIEQEFALAVGEMREWNPRLQLERMAATVVVSAQAEPAAAEAIAAPVTVITRAEIEQRQAQTLAPLLATLPGFAISRLGREGSLTTLFLNGGNSNFTKVLVDGAAINEPGGLVDFSLLTLDNVEKIEVVRGAESALHGSDAMAGVVQVFTHRGTTHRPVLDLRAEGGRFSTARGAARVSGLVGHFDYSAAAARFDTGGQGPNDSFRNTTLSGNFGGRLSETSTLRLSLRSHTSDAGVPGQTALIPPDLNEHSALRNFSASLAWEFQTGARWRHRVAASDTYIRQLFADPASDFCSSVPPFACDFPFSVRNQFNRAGFGAQSSFVAAGSGLTLGYQYEIENGFFSGTHGRRNNQAGYVEARRQFGRLAFTAGARAEANASFGTRVVPRAGAAYALRLGKDFWGATRLRFSYGLGIKEPSLAQSFAQSACFPGNSGLRPERSRALNAGVEQILARDRLRVSVDWFHNRFRDIVSFAFGQYPGAPPPSATCPFGYGSFFNTDLARARGANVAIEAKAARWLRVAGNYSYVDSRVLESPNAFDPALVPGNRLLRRPVHSGSLAFDGNVRRLTWSLLGMFVGERTDSDFLGFGLTRNPGYERVDLAASYELRHGVTAFGRIENLLDKQHEETLGYPALRRSYRLGMKFLFGGE
jgi:outer membrane cobalamin receptor